MKWTSLSDNAHHHQEVVFTALFTCSTIPHCVQSNLDVALGTTICEDTEAHKESTERTRTSKKSYYQDRNVAEPLLTSSLFDCYGDVVPRDEDDATHGPGIDEYDPT